MLLLSNLMILTKSKLEQSRRIAQVCMHATYYSLCKQLCRHSTFSPNIMWKKSICNMKLEKLAVKSAMNL